MYKKIEIHITEYPEKYLLISDNNTLYVGVIVKDILHLLKKKISIDIIKEKINYNYDIKLKNQDIIDVKLKLDKFLFKQEKSSLNKIINLFNPNDIINVSERVISIFYRKYFYVIFFTFFLINIYFYLKFPSYQNEDKTFYQYLIIYSTVLVILFFHEIGHLVAANTYKINVTEIGFGLYYIFPVFYINLKETWKLKTDKRNIINLSGIYSQLLIGILLISIMFLYSNSVVLATVFKMNFYIILLNTNPFLRFDGYWVISDLLEENNLLKVSNNLLTLKFNKTDKKISSWIILYSLFRLVFVICLIIIAIKKILSIIFKHNNHIELTSFEKIFILMVLLYILKSIITKIKTFLQ